jgi:hypothetical protein
MPALAPGAPRGAAGQGNQGKTVKGKTIRDYSGHFGRQNNLGQND